MAARCIYTKSVAGIDIDRGLPLDDRCKAELPGGGRNVMTLLVSDGGGQVWEFDYILRPQPRLSGNAWSLFAISENLQVQNTVKLYAEEANGARYRIEVIRP